LSGGGVGLAGQGIGSKARPQSPQHTAPTTHPPSPQHTTHAQDLGEGVLFFNGTAGGGVQASDHIIDLKGESDMRAFIDAQSDQVLTVVDVSLTDAAPCIHVFPAVLALARSFKGYAAFGRVIADASEEGQQLLKAYNVVEVPTFLFFKNGREVDRCVRPRGGVGVRYRRRLIRKLCVESCWLVCFGLLLAFYFPSPDQPQLPPKPPPITTTKQARGQQPR